MTTWRVGRKVGRTLYEQRTDDDDGTLFGMVDTAELAAMIVRDHNHVEKLEAEVKIWKKRAAERRRAYGESVAKDMSLRDVLETYLLGCGQWQEHPEHAGTNLQWEDLHNGVGKFSAKILPTDLAALRQMVYESARSHDK